MQLHSGGAELAKVFSYHEATKHRLERFAAGPGYLKWEDQPNPFREFAGCDLIALPLNDGNDSPTITELFSATSRTPQPLTRQTLGHFFQHSLALSAWKETNTARWSLRINPSSGNLHPTEAYALLPPLEGIGSSSGAFHYLSLNHSLQLRSQWTRPAGNGFYVAFTSIPWREAWKYGERAFRYCQHDLGHALAAVGLSAATLGWRATLLDASAPYLDWVLGLHPPVHPLEPEIAEALVWIEVGAPSSLDNLPKVDSPIEWFGQPNRLSAGHTFWPLIAEVAASTRSAAAPGLKSEPAYPLWPAPKPVPCAAPATEIIRQRRSALNFDETTALSYESFVSILDATLPRPQVTPFDLWKLPVSVHLALFVHRVTGLLPGLYLYVRDLGQCDALHAALHPDFLWKCDRPTELPLFALKLGDVRSIAKSISCHQDIAADGAFSLGMVARFEPTLQQRGPHAYRELFWETGLIGQCLYLAAEAAGIRATGIGCFFDDVMHDTLGLKDRSWQSLYHFTMGTPVDDPRLRTAPPYRQDL